MEIRVKRTSESVAASGNPSRLALRVFVLFTAIYLVTWAGHYTSGDGTYKVAWAKSMLFGPGAAPANSSVSSKYGIGHSLLAVPSLAAAHFIYKETGIRCEAALYTLIFVVNGAFFLGLVAYYLGHFYATREVWRTVMIAGLATTWWPYTKLDFSEPLVLTAVFLGFVLMRFGHPFWGLLVAGYALTIRTDAIVIMALLVLWHLHANRSMRAGVHAALALAPSIAVVLFANYIRYHSLLDRGYGDERFSNPMVVGLYGILLSSGKSLFLFSPPLLLGALGWKPFADRAETRSDAWFFLCTCVSQMLLYAKWWDWSSDDAWGVRFLIPGVLLMCIPMVAILNRRMIAIPLAACGILVQLLAVTVGGLDYLLLMRSHQAQRTALYVGGSNRVDFEDIRFDPNYSQIVGNWTLLRCLLGVPPAPGRPGDATLSGTRLYDALPPRAWAEAARWDFVWNLHRTGQPSDLSHPGLPASSQPVP